VEALGATEVNPPTEQPVVEDQQRSKSSDLLTRRVINMKHPLRMSAAILCGLALLATNTRQAAADILYSGTAYEGTILYTATMNGLEGVSGSNTSSEAASFYSQMSPSSFSFGTSSLPAFQTYCVDLFQTNQYRVVEQAAVSTFGGMSTDGSGYARNIGAAGWVVQNYGETLNTLNTSAAWTALYSAAGLTGAQIATIGYAEQNAIVQAAVWGTAYDANSTTISGNGSEGAIVNKVLQALLTAASGQSSLVGFINYPPNQGATSGTYNQDMLYVAAVPEPSTLAIAGLGALGLLGYGWKRRKLS
jgi:PEP-CTERM motif-containing protein